MRAFRTRETRALTIFGMGNPDTKAALWAAVQEIMKSRYGGENLNRLAKDSKIGLGSASRIKDMDTSVGLEILDKLAKAYGLEPWQLLLNSEDRAQFMTVLKAWAYPEGRDMLILASRTVLQRYVRDEEERGGGERDIRPSPRQRR